MPRYLILKRDTVTPDQFTFLTAEENLTTAMAALRICAEGQTIEGFANHLLLVEAVAEAKDGKVKII